MKELLKVSTTPKGNKVIKARDLWRDLEIGRDFSNWIKSYIEDYGFIEGKDFAMQYYNIKGQKISLAKKGETGNQQFIHRIEYVITIDMAKHICMLQRSEQGMRMRQYLIEVEKQWRKGLLPELRTPEEMMLQSAQIALEHRKRLDVLEKKTDNVEKRVIAIEERSVKAVQEMQELPPTKVEVPEITTRTYINKYVRSVCRSMNLEYEPTWRYIYNQYDSRYHTNIRICASNRSLTALDYLEKEGKLEELYALIIKLYPSINQ